MAGDFGDELIRIFRQAEDPPSMEALLANAALLADDGPPQVPPPAHVQHPGHPMAVDPRVQPVEHPANAMIHEQHARPPAMHYIQQYQHAPPPAQHFEQHQNMPGQVPPATYFQPYQQMLGNFAPSTMPLHHQHIPAGLPPANLPSEAQQMLRDFPPSPMQVRDEQMLRDIPPAPTTMPVHHQQTLADWSAAAVAAGLPFHGQHTQGGSSSQPVHHQHGAHESTSAVAPLDDDELLGDSSQLMWPDDIFKDDENVYFDFDIDAFLRAEGIIGSDNENDNDSDNDSSTEENSSGSSTGDDYLENYVLPAPAAGEETAVFVPISQQQLQDCYKYNCVTFSELRHVNGRLAQYFAVHRDARNSRFLHANVVRMYNGVDGQNNNQEMMRLDLSGRTQAWVLRFIARSTEAMRNSGGMVVVNTPPDGDVAGSSSSATVTEPTDEAEIDMLCELFAAPADAMDPGPAAPAPTPTRSSSPESESESDPETTTLVHRPVILESNTRPRQASGGAAGVAADPTQYLSWVISRQQKPPARDVSAEEEKEIREFTSAAREKALKEMSMKFPSSIKKICTDNDNNKSIVNRIRANNKKLKRLHWTAMRRSGRDLLGLKEKGVMYQRENKRLYATLVKEVRRRNKRDGRDGGCAPPRKKDHGSDPSGGGGRSGRSGGGGGGGAAGAPAAVS